MRVCFSVRIWFRKIQALIFFFFFCLLIFFQFEMNLLVKIYMKKHNRHNKTLCTADFFNSVRCLVYCSSINQVPYFILKKKNNCDRPKFDTSAAQKKKKKKKKKTLKKIAFRSGLSICHKLWDIEFFSFSLSSSYVLRNLKQAVTVGVNQIYFFVLLFLITISWEPNVLLIWNKGHRKENFISFHYIPKTHFDLCSVPNAFAIMPHIYQTNASLCGYLCVDLYLSFLKKKKKKKKKNSFIFDILLGS